MNILLIKKKQEKEYSAAFSEKKTSKTSERKSESSCISNVTDVNINNKKL